jgi:succinyl-CoA synthetase beta subunit
VRRCWSRKGADIKKEYYVAAVTDRATQKVAMMASSEGGMDIEQVAHDTPEKIVKVFIDPKDGMTDPQAAELARGIGVPARRRRRRSTSSRSSTPATWRPTPRWPRSIR